MTNVEASQVPIIFELHIRPMFRLIDQQHMMFFGDIWNYAALMETPEGETKTRAEIILDLVCAQDGFMPPNGFGGPWPQEWITLYQRWLHEGCGHLATGAADSYKAARQSGNIRVQGVGNVPTPNFQVWLNLEVADRNTPLFEYTLFLMPPDGDQPAVQTPFVANDTINNAPAGLKTIIVNDAKGKHAVKVM